jgi:hypothetical protein
MKDLSVSIQIIGQPGNPQTTRPIIRHSKISYFVKAHFTQFPKRITSFTHSGDCVADIIVEKLYIRSAFL